MGTAKIEAARHLLAGGMPIKDVAVTLEVGISTLYRYGLAGAAVGHVGQEGGHHVASNDLVPGRR
jgi:hypothetical protein